MFKLKINETGYNLLKAKNKNFKVWLIGLFCAIIVVPVFWFLCVRLEGQPPTVSLNPDISSVGISQQLTLSVADEKSGLRHLWFGLLQKGKEIQLLENDFPSSRIIGGGQVHDRSFDLSLEPKKLGLSDGEAIIRIAVSDFSWRRWWKGNQTYTEKQIVIDTRAPGIDVLTRAHNIIQGGAGLVIYKVSEPCSETGVYVGENFFPGRSGYFQNENVMLAFFALGYEQGAETQLSIKASDNAGNITCVGFPHYIKKKAFKTDTIQISDRFLTWKMPEFSSDLPEALNSATDLDKFLYVNRDIRKANYDTITGIASRESSAQIYWEGEFLRLPRSARRANFADQRQYVYQGRHIDRQIHLGIDLASTSLAPVPAANAGKVVFAGSVGIYGMTVIIDHGFGLSSSYSHLSSFAVETGQMVSKGDVIGHTGITGMAGGDHLHFGMLVHNTFVNPVEWWDASWIRNNITDKLETVKAALEASK